VGATAFTLAALGTSGGNSFNFYSGVGYTGLTGSGSSKTSTTVNGFGGLSPTFGGASNANAILNKYSEDMVVFNPSSNAYTFQLPAGKFFITAKNATPATGNVSLFLALTKFSNFADGFDQGPSNQSKGILTEYATGTSILHAFVQQDITTFYSLRVYWMSATCNAAITVGGTNNVSAILSVVKLM